MFPPPSSHSSTTVYLTVADTQHITSKCRIDWTGHVIVFHLHLIKYLFKMQIPRSPSWLSNIPLWFRCSLRFENYWMKGWKINWKPCLCSFEMHDIVSEDKLLIYKAANWAFISPLLAPKHVLSAGLVFLANPLFPHLNNSDHSHIIALEKRWPCLLQYLAGRWLSIHIHSSQLLLFLHSINRLACVVISGFELFNKIFLGG